MEREGPRRVRRETDQRRQLALFAEGITEQLERVRPMDDGPFREGVTVEDAAAGIWTLTSPEVLGMLREAWGWSARHYRRWLRDTLKRTLLPDPAPDHGEPHGGRWDPGGARAGSITSR